MHNYIQKKKWTGAQKRLDHIKENFKDIQNIDEYTAYLEKIILSNVLLTHVGVAWFFLSPTYYSPKLAMAGITLFDFIVPCHCQRKYV